MTNKELEVLKKDVIEARKAYNSICEEFAAIKDMYESRVKDCRAGATQYELERLINKMSMSKIAYDTVLESLKSIRDTISGNNDIELFSIQEDIVDD